MKAFEEYKKNNNPFETYPCPDREGATFEDGYFEGLEAGYIVALKWVLTLAKDTGDQYGSTGIVDIPPRGVDKIKEELKDESF